MELKKRILKLEEEKANMKNALYESQANSGGGQDATEVFQLKEVS